MYGAEAVLPEEVKHRSLRTATATPACPSEAKEKDLLESDKLKVMANLQKYQKETMVWRDPKVKLWAIWYFCEALTLKAPANLRSSGLDHMS
jgi:hypothetical protein